MLLKERNTNVNLIIFKCAGQEENRKTKLVDRKTKLVEGY